jgi:hypothetical protein
MTNAKIIRKIKKKIWGYLKDLFYYERVYDTPIIQNINYRCILNQKRAVIIYLTANHLINWEEHSKGRTIPLEIFKILETFIDLGYSIDIAGCNDVLALELLKSKHYDIIFGFGEVFYQLTNFQPLATSILYMTENHPDFSYQEEMKRLDYFKERHKKTIKITRSGVFYKPYHLDKLYSYVITMSETKPLEKQYSNPFTIFPTGIINRNYVFGYKDHKGSRNHFLWLGSAGVIHKGLDLLIDVFEKRNDIVLHICGISKEDNVLLTIPKRSNIINYGHININSDLFLNINNLCSFIILPSCSEACSTSITTGMLHGLIPIVMKDAGFNRLGENAIFLNDFKIEYLTYRLKEIADSDFKELEILSKRVYDFAHQNFLIDVFEENFKQIMQTILSER